MNKHFGLLVAIMLLTAGAFAQNVTGEWYGVGKVDAQGNSYLSELILVQKGKTVTGELNYYFRDSLFKNKITGTFDAATRTLELNTTKIIYHQASNTVTGVDCPMAGQFILRIAKTESVLTGILFSNKEFRYTCPDINFKLKKQTNKPDDEPTIPITKTEPKQEDTTKTKPAVTVATNTDPKTNTEKKAATPEEKHAVEEFAKREKVYAREIEITNNELQLEFYDNGAIDGDSISVFFNNQLVLPKSLLNHRAIRFTVKINDELPFNELTMLAESLGFIPPNTAALIIHDGTKRYELLLTSDFNKSSTVKLIKQRQ